MTRVTRSEHGTNFTGEKVFSVFTFNIVEKDRYFPRFS